MNAERVIALGFFDGVHLGHGALLETARRRADAQNLLASALTFDAHPDTVVFGTPMPLLTTPEDRFRIMQSLYRMDEVLTIHFDKAMMSMPWEDFVDKLLVETYHARHVVCGHDFSFGYRGQGTPERLAEKCHSLGIGCDIIPKVELDSVTISSTYIRKLVSEGQMKEAERYLGHPHSITGTVTHGKQLGRRLGIPTANLPLPEGILPPAFGVYACRVHLEDGSVYSAVTNVGNRPTVDDHLGTLIEPWLLDYEGDLYGQTIRIDFCRHLRPEQKFDSLEALQAEIHRNAQQTREYFAK